MLRESCLVHVYLKHTYMLPKCLLLGVLLPRKRVGQEGAAIYGSRELGLC